MNIVFDLDGTLIDSKQRLYTLFQHLANVPDLTYSEYWDLKQNKVSNQEILAQNYGYTESQIQRFVQEWMRLIEAPEFIKLDSNLHHIHDTLSLLKNHAELYVCTARQHRSVVIDQLEDLHLLPFFCKVLVTEQSVTKEELIANHVSQLSMQDWMVGDTGMDVLCGKSLGMNTCAVLSGFLSKASLLQYESDLLLDSVTEFQPKALGCH